MTGTAPRGQPHRRRATACPGSGWGGGRADLEGQAEDLAHCRRPSQEATAPLGGSPVRPPPQDAPQEGTRPGPATCQLPPATCTSAGRRRRGLLQTPAHTARQPEEVTGRWGQGRTCSAPSSWNSPLLRGFSASPSLTQGEAPPHAGSAAAAPLSEPQPGRRPRRRPRLVHAQGHAVPPDARVLRLSL